MVLPAWLASMTQLPAVWKLTAPAVMEQTAEAEASMVKTTGFPEAPPVAAGV